MSFILSIIKAVIKFRKIMKKAKDAKQRGQAIVKSIKDGIITFCIMGFLAIAIICGAFYSVTGAVAELYERIQAKWEQIWNGGSEDPNKEFYDSLTDEEKKDIQDATGASLDIDKITKYMQTEANSVPSSKEGKEITIENGNESKKDVTIDLKQYADKYKVNWEFVSAVDQAIFEADDPEKTKAIDNAGLLTPTFDWNEDCTIDVTDTWKTWTKKIDYDQNTGVETLISEDESSASENYKTVKTPIAIPNKVTTLFGDYNYTITNDQVLMDSGYSSPYSIACSTEPEEVVDYYKDVKELKYFDYFTNEYGTEIQVEQKNNTQLKKDPMYIYSYDTNLSAGMYYVYTFGSYYKLKLPKASTPYPFITKKMHYVRSDSYEVVVGKEPVYKTIEHRTYTMKKDKSKIVQDMASEPVLNFDPTIFITYLNNCSLKVEDLDLVRECLISIPKGNMIVDNIDRIINGDYGDISSGNTNGPTGNADVSGLIPLFLQADERWANVPYSDETVGSSGCGVTSCAMVLSGLGGNINNVKSYDTNNDGILTPDEVAAYSTSNGHSTHGQGTMRSLYKDLGEKMGLKVTETTDANGVYSALKNGKVVISSMTTGNFTSGSHLIVLTGVSAEGMVNVNDPASKDRSKSWDWNIVKSEADDFWICENPDFITETFTITSYYGATAADCPPLILSEVQMQGNGLLKTSTGVDVKNKDLRDRICAVDPSVIPYHSKVFISFSDSPVVKMPTDGVDVPLTGYYSAEDTGGAFTNGVRKIDLYAGTFGNSPNYKSIAYEIGTKSATVRYRKTTK